MLALLCPGQGSQQAGFLVPWLAVDGFVEALATLSATAGFDLGQAGSRSDADVVDTAVAQPLLVAAGLVSAGLLGPLPSGCVVVGHSVGELTAAGLAGVLDDESVMTLARERGRAMATAATATPSGMTAVLGGAPADVTAAVRAVGCWIANHNATGQVVAAGPVAGLARLDAEPPAGSRLRRLPVSGAFHTPLMSPARTALEPLAASLPVHEPRHMLLSNADGAVVADGHELVGRLVRQVTEPVRWDLCLQALRDFEVTATLELAPGGVLTALVRRVLPDVETVALRTPGDLPAARELAARHGLTGEVWTPGWRVVVAPANGIFHPAVDTLGEVDVTIPMGAVRQSEAGGLRGAVVNVSPPVRGHVLEWLAHDGDPVSAGQPVARVQPLAAS